MFSLPAVAFILTMSAQAVEVPVGGTFVGETVGANKSNNSQSGNCVAGFGLGWSLKVEPTMPRCMPVGTRENMPMEGCGRAAAVMSMYASLSK